MKSCFNFKPTMDKLGANDHSPLLCYNCTNLGVNNIIPSIENQYIYSKTPINRGFSIPSICISISTEYQKARLRCNILEFRPMQNINAAPLSSAVAQSSPETRVKPTTHGETYYTKRNRRHTVQPILLHIGWNPSHCVELDRRFLSFISRVSAQAKQR